MLSNYLPILDGDLKPCRTLARSLGVGSIDGIEAKPGPLEPNKIRIGGKEIFVIDRVQTFTPAKGAKVIAESGGKCCGYEVRVGRGRVTVLGFKLEYLFTALHREVLGAILGRKLPARGVVLERSGGGVTLKTAVNCYDEPLTLHVDGKDVRLPARRAAFILRKGGKRRIFI